MLKLMYMDIMTHCLVNILRDLQQRKVFLRREVKQLS